MKIQIYEGKNLLFYYKLYGKIKIEQLLKVYRIQYFFYYSLASSLIEFIAERKLQFFLIKIQMICNYKIKKSYYKFLFSYSKFSGAYFYFSFSLFLVQHFFVIGSYFCRLFLVNVCQIK